jgi:CRISPR-associated protein Csb2
VWSDRGGELWLVLAGIGRREDFAGRNVAAGQCALLDAARVWVSYTPFVPTRHAKARHTGEPKLDERGLQIGSPEHDLRRLLAERFAEPARVAPLAGTVVGGRSTPWHAFRTVRAGGAGRRWTAAGYGFRLEFSEPVRGPIAVGYGAHFGLGTFTPADGDPAAAEVRS